MKLDDLMQSIRCLFNHHNIGIKTAIDRNGNYHNHFECVHCGKYIGRIN